MNFRNVILEHYVNLYPDSDSRNVFVFKNIQDETRIFMMIIFFAFKDKFILTWRQQRSNFCYFRPKDCQFGPKIIIFGLFLPEIGHFRGFYLKNGPKMTIFTPNWLNSKWIIFGSYFWMLNHERKWKWSFWDFFREQNFKIQLTDAKKKGPTSVFGVWPTEKGMVQTSDKNLKVLEPLCTRITQESAILNKHHFRWTVIFRKKAEVEMVIFSQFQSFSTHFSIKNRRLQWNCSFLSHFWPFLAIFRTIFGRKPHFSKE